MASEMEVFTLNASHEFIPLDKLLKLIGWVGSGGEAHRMIEEGLVEINATVATEKRKKLRPGDHVSFNGQVLVVQQGANE